MRWGMSATGFLNITQVAEKLHALARRLALDEIVINTWTFDPQARRHSYSLLANALGLTSFAATTP
jgi:hypothetical protein